jgi:hypothetical protein
MVNRQNKTVRPDQPVPEGTETIEGIYNKFSTRERVFRLWFERAEEIEEGKAVWPDYSASGSSLAKMLLFLKLIDKTAWTGRPSGLAWGDRCPVMVAIHSNQCKRRS